MSTDEAITQELLRQQFTYDPESGLLTRNVYTGNRPAGSTVGSIDKQGHVSTSVLGKRRFVHRLVFVYMTGRWPAGVVDHKNGIRSDNRWANLRDTTQVVNLQNQRVARSGAASTLLGVTKRKRTRLWSAQIRHEGKLVHLGYFSSDVEAHAAYVEAKRRLHPGCEI